MTSYHPFARVEATPAQLRVLRKLFNAIEKPGSNAWKMVGCTSGYGSKTYTLETAYWWGKVERRERASIELSRDGSWNEYQIQRQEKAIATPTKGKGKKAAPKTTTITVTNPDAPKK
jgi:hypothetical protein